MSTLKKVWPEACLRSDEDIASHDGKTGPEEFLPKSPEWFNSLPDRRVIKTHARVPELLGAGAEAEGNSPVAPLATGAKYIVCTRNPLDACVSCYHHAWNPAKCGWPFPAWVEAWVQSDDHTGYGSWHTWHKHWWALYQKHSDQIVWVREYGYVMF